MIFMKKNILFLIPMLLVVFALFLLRATGMTAHIAVSVVGLVLLIAYTVATKKQWKCPAFEFVTRMFYAVALITGALLMNVHGIAVVSIIHKVSAVLFAVLLAATEIHKAIKK
jgi:hypothetical protein